MAFAPVSRRPIISEPPYKSAIFFENSAEQRAAIIERCPSVKVIKERLDEAPAGTNFIMVDIPETEPPPMYTVTELPFYDEYNEYIVRNRLVSETYDPVSGVQQSHIDNILLPWITSRVEGPHVAIFDWDRTTTVIEGLRMHKTATGAEYVGGNPTQYYVDMLTHLCGGDVRLAALQAMFQRLKEANIHIMFLTNNPSGNYKMFDEMIQVLVDATKPAYSIIVSNSIAYNGVKANVFSMVQQFSELACKKRPVVLAPIRPTSAMPSAFSSFAPLPPAPVRLIPGTENENLYGNYEGGRRRTRRKRKSKTIRRIMRGALRRMRRKRTKRCD
jgi:hypothetical protein